MNIRNLEVFLKTVDLGNLTKAAHMTGYTQSAASHIIANLERELGVHLLVRRRDGVHLTEMGKELLPRIRELRQMSQALYQHAAQLQGLEVGTIRIGTILSVSVHILPALLHRFVQEHPNITFELRQGNYQDIEQWLQDNTIDLGFSRRPTGNTFEILPIVREKFLAIFPRSWNLDKDTFSLEDIRHEAYILRPESLDSELSRFFKSAAYQPQITYSAKDDYAVMAMVEQGLGMSILPELLMQGTNYQFQKRELNPPLYRELCVSYRKDQHLPPAVEQFVAAIQTYSSTLPLRP